jgi:hypothetical protein
LAIALIGTGSDLFAQSAAPPAATAPAHPTSLSGLVRDESNTPVVATVTIATQGLRQSALTAADGSFTFPNLKTGMYAICAVPTAKTGAPFIDSCLWQDRNSLQVPLTPGENQQGIIVPVRHGHPLKVRVNDPNALLPAPIGATAANHLAIHVIGPSGLAQPVLIAAQDAKGRDHMLVVPYDTPLKLLVHSTTFVLKDATGNDLAETTTTSFTATQAGPPPLFVFNVDRPKP